MKLIRTLLCAISLATPIAAEPQICPDPLFSVTADTPATVDRVCRIASKAVRDFAACGITLNTPVDIKVTSAIDAASGECLGVYHCGENRIEVLSFDAFRAARDTDGVFELVSDDAYWDSVVVHELAHAAYDAVPCPFPHCIATSEYVSYVMQVRSLPKDQRALFGQTMELLSPATRDSLSAIMLFLSPDHFAKKSWVHFQNRHAPCDYMQSIMDGDIYFDREMP